MKKNILIFNRICLLIAIISTFVCGETQEVSIVSIEKGIDKIIMKCDSIWFCLKTTPQDIKTLYNHLSVYRFSTSCRRILAKLIYICYRLQKRNLNKSKEFNEMAREFINDYMQFYGHKNEEGSFVKYLSFCFYCREIPAANYLMNNTENALKEVDFLKKEYPNSIWTQKALLLEQAIKEHLALHYLYLADLHIKKGEQGNILSALNSALSFETKHSPYALYLLTLCYKTQNMMKEHKEKKKLLIEKYPDSKYALTLKSEEI